MTRRLDLVAAVAMMLHLCCCDTVRGSQDPWKTDRYHRNEITNDLSPSIGLLSQSSDLFPPKVRSFPTTTKRRKRNGDGVVKLDFQGHDVSSFVGAPFNETKVADPFVEVKFDPSSFVRCILGLVDFSTSFGAAFMGTLRLLAPLVLARRALNVLGELGMDYMRGRYVRRTYSRLENVYIQYYELPAVLRVTTRATAQMLILMSLSIVFGRILGLVLSCQTCKLWSTLVQVFAVLGAGNVALRAISHSTPLRIQQYVAEQPHRRRFQVFTRPWHIFEMMKDPEEWINMIAAPRSQQRTSTFHANAILFPATWIPIKTLQLIAAIKAATKSGTAFRSFWFYIAVSDEWHRTFLKEKRVALAMIVGLVYSLATLSLTATIASIDKTAGLLSLPSLLAVVVSGWMNVVICWNRLEPSKRQAFLTTLRSRKRASCQGP